MKTCKHCGAVLSHNETKFEDIIGQEHAKRALEVALAGNHTIAFIGNHEAEALAEWATSHGLTARATQTCPCGHFGDPIRECTCSLSQVARWQKRKAYQNALGVEIVIECPPPYADKVRDWANGRWGEPEAAMLARVEDRGQPPGQTLDQTGKSLLGAVIKQLGCDTDCVKSILSVAQTIAALSKADHIQACHLAEAIQYRPRNGR